METCTLENLDGLQDLVRRAQQSAEPLIVLDGDEECLVAMRPAVLERLLFDTDLLNCEKQETMRF